MISSSFDQVSAEQAANITLNFLMKCFKVQIVINSQHKRGIPQQILMIEQLKYFHPKMLQLDIKIFFVFKLTFFQIYIINFI